MSRPLAAVVLAAGLGTRMRSETPKHLHLLLGRRLVDWVIEAVRPLQPDRLVVVASPDTATGYDGVDVAIQGRPLGTGDAAASARPALDGFDGDVLVVAGDSPLVKSETLARLVADHRAGDTAATLLSFEPPRPLPYGRIVRDETGALRAIVEEGDATEDQRTIRELNASTYVFRAADLWISLEQLNPDNVQGELYLTDTIGQLVAAGREVAVHKLNGDASEALGVNTRADLAVAAAVLRDRINEAHMLAGVTIVDPATTWIEPSVDVDPDAMIHPFTVLRGSTRIGRGAEVGPHVVAIDAAIGPDATVGPFCYLRPGTVLAAGAKAGTFVEIKNSTVGEGAKVPHLSYVGDADVGDATNVGAGAITANFPHEPGREKGRTRIGRNVRTGVQNAFVAPVEVGDDAWIAAGAVITDDVPPGSLAGFPPKQTTKEGWVYERFGTAADAEPESE